MLIIEHILLTKGHSLPRSPYIVSLEGDMIIDVIFKRSKTRQMATCLIWIVFTRSGIQLSFHIRSTTTSIPRIGKAAASGSDLRPDVERKYPSSNAEASANEEHAIISRRGQDLESGQSSPAQVRSKENIDPPSSDFLVPVPDQ